MRFTQLRTDDSGYATVSAAGFSAALIGLFVALAWQAGGLVAREESQNAADLAAVAGAYQFAMGESTSSACHQAEWVVELNRGVLKECTIKGEDLFTEVMVRGQVAWARAGPL